MTLTQMPNHGGGRVSKLPLLAFEAKRHANHDAIAVEVFIEQVF